MVLSNVILISKRYYYVSHSLLALLAFGFFAMLLTPELKITV